MYRSILVPFSDWQSERSALEAAIALAKKSAARLHIVHMRRGRTSAGALAAEDAALDAAVDWAIAELDESVSFRMIPNAVAGVTAADIADRLAEYADRNEIELIVMSHRPHSAARESFGSVGARLREQSGATFLLVPPGAPNFARRGCRALVVVDGTAAADAIAREAAGLARLLSGNVTIAGVIDTADTDPVWSTEHVVACIAGVTRELRAIGTDVENVELARNPAEAALRATESPSIDLVAVPNEAGPRSNIQQWLLAQLLESFAKPLLVHGDKREAKHGIGAVRHMEHAADIR